MMMSSFRIRRTALAIRNRAAMAGVHLMSKPGAMLRVGSLIREDTGVIRFLVDDDFLNMGPSRPVLSIAWLGSDERETKRRLQDSSDKIMRSGLLPPYFQNMLPEGALRELVEAEFGTGDFDDFDVIVRLGGDLPGAVVVRLETGNGTVPTSARQKPPVPSGRVKFSLSGVQLKFTVLETDRGVTAPGRDRQGDIILKVPSEKYPLLAELEYTGLALARAVGVRTADAFLVDVNDIENIPAEYLKGGGNALALRRFDRGERGAREHTEDFAQILGAIGDRKYTVGNCETLLRMIGRFSEDTNGEMLEGVRRIVCNIMMGNGDAHLKNWSFLHRGFRQTELTPAYDLVPTFLYGDHDMALKFGGTRDPRRVTMHRFERAAGFAGVHTDLFVDEARRTVEAILDTWPDLLDGMPVPQETKDMIIERWSSLAIISS